MKLGHYIRKDGVNMCSPESVTAIDVDEDGTRVLIAIRTLDDAKWWPIKQFEETFREWKQ